MSVSSSLTPISWHAVAIIHTIFIIVLTVSMNLFHMLSYFTKSHVKIYRSKHSISGQSDSAISIGFSMRWKLEELKEFLLSH